MELQYKKVHLYVLPDLCADLILSLDFQTQHQSITLKYGGKWPPLDLVCGLSLLNVKPPDLFANIVDDCHQSQVNHIDIALLTNNLLRKKRRDC